MTKNMKILRMIIIIDKIYICWEIFKKYILEKVMFRINSLKKAIDIFKNCKK